MGSIEPYETSAGRRYKVQFRKPDRSTTTKRGFPTKRAAQLFLAQAELHIASGTWIDGQASRVTVAELGPPWLAAKAHLKPSSFHVLTTAWRIHVEPVWGARTVGSITPSEIQDWVADLTRRRSATVVIRAYGVLAGVLERAVNDRQIALSPARHIALPRKGRKHRSYLTHAQVDALSMEAREHRTMVLLLAYTGLRWGEAVALRVESVDFARERLLVRANAVNVAGKIIPGTPKSHDSRSVAFPHFLAARLQYECAGKAPGDLVFGAGVDYLPTPTHKDGWFAGARRRSVLADSTFPPKLTIHDLRHTAASLAISAGANVKAVQRMLGHASAAMTLDTYADLFEDDLDAVASALDQARASSVAVKTQSRAGQATPIDPQEARKYAAERGVKKGAPLAALLQPRSDLGRHPKATHRGRRGRPREPAKSHSGAAATPAGRRDRQAGCALQRRAERQSGSCGVSSGPRCGSSASDEPGRPPERPCTYGSSINSESDRDV